METLQRIRKQTTNFPTIDFPRAKEGETQKYHGWFSQKYISQSKRSIIYFNENGEEIEVTEVSTSARPAVRFDDLEYKGVMVKYHRIVYK